MASEPQLEPVPCKADVMQNNPFTERASTIGAFSDITLLPADKTPLYCSRALLSMSSSVLAEVLRSTDTSELEFEDASTEAMSVILKIIFPVHLTREYGGKITIHNVEEILHIGHKFDIQVVCDRCEEFLCSPDTCVPSGNVFTKIMDWAASAQTEYIQNYVDGKNGRQLKVAILYWLERGLQCHLPAVVDRNLRLAALMASRHHILQLRKQFVDIIMRQRASEALEAFLYYMSRDDLNFTVLSSGCASEEAEALSAAGDAL